MELLSASSHRIVVVGTSCAGKSTFAKQLSRATYMRYIELDELYWDCNWVPKPREKFVALVNEVVANDKWIADGNYGSIRDVLWPRTTTVVWLNYSFSVVFWRALRRTIHRAISGQMLWHGNHESLRRSFLSRDSILVWVITTFHRRRREIRALRDHEYAHVEWIEFARPREAERYLKVLSNCA